MPFTEKRLRYINVGSPTNGKKPKVADVRIIDANERLVSPASDITTTSITTPHAAVTVSESRIMDTVAVQNSLQAAIPVIPSIQQITERKVRAKNTCVHYTAHLVTPRPSVIDLATLDSASLQSEDENSSDWSSDSSTSMPSPAKRTIEPTPEVVATPTTREEKSVHSISLFKIIIGLLLTTLAVIVAQLPIFNLSAPKDSVCVSGGGFSGFWFTLGRLDSIPDPSSKDYYCYSAGCLGVIATLSGNTMEEMYDMAHRIQREWKRGEISRYQIVPKFIDNLLYASNRTVLDPALLPRLNIETTVRDGLFGVKTSIRTPDSIESLRTMLVQTTWIPFAVGDDLWHLEHMDGAFSIPYHPRCEHHVGLAPDLDLLANVINVNLGRAKVEKFWNKGLLYGL